MAIINNIIQVNGANSTIIEFLAYIKSYKRALDFNKVLPCKTLVHGKLVEVREIMAVQQNKWGSSSNASYIRIVNNTIAFTTANNPPHKVVQELSDRFPELEIHHKWAGRDYGLHCGDNTYYHGHLYSIQVGNYDLKARRLYKECCESQALSYDTVC